MNKGIISIFIIALCYTKYTCNALEFEYHNYNDLTAILKKYAKDYPDKTYLYSIGKSVEGRDLWAMAIARTQPDRHVLLRPEAKYVGNMHGNEVAGREILIHLIDYMLTNATRDESVDYIMSNTRVHIMPTMNPDGFEKSVVGECMTVNGRRNGNNKDLNRNFPDLFECNEVILEPETKAILRWLNTNNFILSANLHGGSVVANYPFDNYRGASGTDYDAVDSPTDDEDIFKSISKIYSFNHLTMRNAKECGSFVDGITNGAEWYPLRGGMQDLNYWGFGCSEITIELTCCKYPTADKLRQIWLDNKKALIEYLKLANTGLRGVIRYENGQPAENISVQIDSREPIFKTNQNGEYYKLLTSGSYTLRLMFNCQEIYQTSIQIQNTSLLVLNITLPDSSLQNAKNFTLDKYPTFCKQNNYPECSNVQFNKIKSESDFSISNYTLSFDNLNSSGARNLYYSNTIIMLLIACKFLI